MEVKMAKATEADLLAALDIAAALESISGNWQAMMPEKIADPEDEPFDVEDADQCRRLFDHLVSLTRRGSLFRVVYGMAVLLDPVNELVDPDSGTLKMHPSLVRKTEASAAKAEPEVGP